MFGAVRPCVVLNGIAVLCVEVFTLRPAPGDRQGVATDGAGGRGEGDHAEGKGGSVACHADQWGGPCFEPEAGRPRREEADPATSGCFSRARDVAGGVVTATPLTMTNREVAMARTGSWAAPVTRTPAALARTIRTCLAGRRQRSIILCMASG